MADYSNRAIVALLAVANVVTVVGTVVSVSKLNELGGTYSYLTGAAVDVSQTGQTNLTLTSTTSLTMANTFINFCSGRVNASCRGCAMDTNKTFVNILSNTSTYGGATVTNMSSSRECCVNFCMVSEGFLIENTGNTIVSVVYTCSSANGNGNCTRVGFTGSALGGLTSWGGTNGLDIKMNSNLVRKQAGETGLTDTAASCAGGGSVFRDGGWNITNSSSYSQGGPANNSVVAQGSYIPLSSLGHWLCGNFTNFPLMPDNGKDAGVLDFNVTISDDAQGTGVTSSFTLTFNATSSG